MTGVCECGCGGRTAPAKYTDRRDGTVKGEPLRFLSGHQSRGRSNPQYRGGVQQQGQGYVYRLLPGHPHADKRGRVLEHVAVACERLGTALPPGANVHHVNGDPSDNRPGNLVVCEDMAYHKLLHARARAVEACGHADWARCIYCDEWSPPDEIRLRSVATGTHRRSHARAERQRHQRRRMVA